MNISDCGLRFGSTKLGAAAILGALTLAVLSALLLIGARPAQAQTETVLYNFAGSPDGSYPDVRPTAHNGNLYGTTFLGGLGGNGTVFELSPNGSGGWNETVIYTFTGGVDGANPSYSNLIFDSQGNLYGTASFGGANGLGVVFELSPAGTSWTETVVHAFAGIDGAYPINGLIMDTAGNLFGRTWQGGSAGDGTVFELSPSGSGWTEQVIDNFNSKDLGNLGLAMDAAGNIFGVSDRHVFELSPNGNGGWSSTEIHYFVGNATGIPAFDSAGNLYFAAGGRQIYELIHGKRGWSGRILYAFKGGTDGSDPLGGVVLDAAGNVYGTTFTGGGACGGYNKHGCGTVFELIAPVGKGNYVEKVLWRFNDSDGVEPINSLLLDSAGNLYGTTIGGGSSGNGVVFEITP